jgi:hypothetical protein
MMKWKERKGNQDISKVSSSTLKKAILDKAEALLQQIFDRVLVILSMKQRNTYS